MNNSFEKNITVVFLFSRPAELQFYTSIASIVVQIPACFFMMDLEKVHRTLDMTLLTVLVLNGTFFHFQSITAYVLMDYISPVTHRYVYFTYYKLFIYAQHTNELSFLLL